MMDIVAQIPPCAKRVVELGASRERAGEAFLRIQPGAEYYGVTAELGELRELGSFLTHAFCVQPERLSLEELGIYEADALIIRGQFLRNLTADRLRQWAGGWPALAGGAKSCLCAHPAGGSGRS